MREIGSEFCDVSPVKNGTNGIFLEATNWFLSGRSALQAIIKELKNCHSVAMPSWCCDSMIKPFVDAGIEIQFYPVFWDGRLIQEISLNSDILFLMDYFGYTGLQPDVSDFKGVIIRDVTHSIFSNRYSDADYYYGSLRKWCGVWTGGYAWTKDGNTLTTENTDDGGYTALRERAMQQKSNYLYGLDVSKRRMEKDKGYLKLFEQAEKKLDYLGALPAAKRDVQVAELLDIENIKLQRRKNARVLRSSFSEWLVFPDMQETDCPMFVPILIPDGKRNELRRYLIDNDIYCPVHWPVSKYHRVNERTEYIYKNELSLVCDQRYTENDMNRMVEAIRTFRQEE